jgi:hypothetical protein
MLLAGGVTAGAAVAVDGKRVAVGVGAEGRSGVGGTRVKISAAPMTKIARMIIPVRRDMRAILA